MVSLCTRLLAFSVLPVLLAASASAASGLSTDSPFMPISSAQGAAVAGAMNLEFRGLVEIDRVDYFNVADLSTKKAAWVQLNQAGASFVVRAHEKTPEGDVISVEQAGRVLRLAMVRPKIGNAPVVNVVPAAQQGPVFPVVLNPTAADEARRMEAFAAEVRRRRLLRQQEAAQRQAARQGEGPLPVHQPAP